MDLVLHSVMGNSQRLDGGAMYGNAPRALWSKWSPPDELNRISLACRTLLAVEPGGRSILFETGIGAFFAPPLRERFGVVESEHVLLEGLSRLGRSHADIDVVVLSHLHFDHAGGLLAAHEEGKAPELLFPKARFVVGREAFERSRHPHRRDRASFIPELAGLLEASGRLELVEGPKSRTLGSEYSMHVSHGHTPGMLLAELPARGGPVVFAADLVPGRPWVRPAITMGYDRFPELLIDEKTRLFQDLVDREGRLFFTHDPEISMAKLTREEGGFSSTQPMAVLSGHEH